MRARRATAHHPSLVVEVAEDDVNPSTLFTESVLYGHLDIVKGDICRAGGGGISRLDSLRGDIVITLNEDDCESLLQAVTWLE